jgi:GNAT superfamily N-acetyltransferase
MSPRPLRYTRTWWEPARLRDGSPVGLRCVRPEDAPLVREAFARLSHEARLKRFHAVKNTLTAAELRYFTQLDGSDHFALGAVALAGPEAGRGVGVARFVRFAERPTMAEASFTIVDPMQGKGLGRLLVAHLVEAARERGVERFECSVLHTNYAMRRLLTPLGPTCTPAGDGTLLYDVPLHAPAARWQHEAHATG